MTATVWLLGDAGRAEWRALWSRLEPLLSSFTVVRLANANEASARLDVDAPPELLVAFESWPDEFPAAHVAELLAALPLTRVVCVRGFWCEAAGRTRAHWPLGLTVPFWLAEERVQCEVDVLAGRRNALPWTATRDEWIESVPLVPRQKNHGGTAAATAVLSRGERASLEIFDPALRAELTRQLESLGIEVSDHAGAVVILQAEPASPERLSAIAERCRTADKVVAVTTWPLPEWCEQLCAAGVCAVVNPLEPAELRNLFRIES